MFDDAALLDGLVVGRELTHEIVAVAARHSRLGHVGDWSVRPAAVVSSRIDVVRATALVDDGSISPADAAYLRMRGQEPSGDALARFAAYVQNVTQTEQRLVVVDRSELSEVDFEGLPGQYSSVPYQVAGNAGVSNARSIGLCRTARGPGSSVNVLA